MKKLIIATLSMALIACVGSKTTPPVQTFALATANATPGATFENILLVAPASIAPQFSNFAFIYRVSETQYLTDPYRQFLSAPNIQVSNYLQNQLNSSVNATIIGSASLLHANYVLQENIDAMYGDYREKTAPLAVMNINFTFYQVVDNNAVAAGTLSLHETTAITPNDPNSLIEGYQHDLDKMLPKLSEFVNNQLISNNNSTKTTKS